MRLVIMRGVSGSDKSTRAKEIHDNAGNYDTAVICSADEYFMQDGTYQFDPRLLGQAHAWCRGRASAAMELCADLVIIDNTNTQAWEYETYLSLAARYDYEVEYEVVGQLDDESLELYASRNTHGVPLEVIRKQAQRFE